MLLVAVVALLAAAAPARVWAAPASKDDVPADVRRVLGNGAEKVGRGHYRVKLADGKALLTHGPDRAADDPAADFAPGSPERPPVCAPNYRQHVLYGRLAVQPDRYATVKPQIQSAVRRMNYVLNQESLESGGKTADFRVRCDTGGQIEVGKFTSTVADFDAVVSAARAAGYNAGDTNYTIFFDSDGGFACGVGSYWDDERPVAENYNNRGGGYAVAFAGCWNGRTPMHEATHNMGAVQYNSPHSTGTGAHCRDGLDVMCYSDGGDRDTGLITRCADRMHYDCGYDDYFDSSPEPGEYLATHWNVGSALNRFINFGGQATTVWGWGLNQNGELGSGSAATSNAPVPSVGMVGVRQVASGGYHSLALKDDGTVWSWGYNNVGQLGVNSLTDRFSPVQVPGLTNVTAVAGGFAHSLALKSDGTVWAWGWNRFAQLGDGSTTDLLLPVQVAGLSGVTAIAAGVGHTLARKADGTLVAWGLNNKGQLGDGSTVEWRAAPAPVSGLGSVKSITAGGYHNLVVKNDGTLWSWGLNKTGQLGTGVLSPNRSLPGSVSGISSVAEAAGGFAHSIVRKTDGTVWVWGWNGMGQLGVGALVDVWSPQRVSGVTGAIGLAAGGYHSLVLLANKTVQGFGWGGFGQLGAVLSRLVPGVVVTGHDVRAVAAGLGHNLQVVG
ncbi:MAG: hypothetical protein M3179_07230 [Actinomycetota bacterium]|nr:hypothetical protein [Actinomycetota bacterium]